MWVTRKPHVFGDYPVLFHIWMLVEGERQIWYRDCHKILNSKPDAIKALNLVERKESSLAWGECISGWKKGKLIFVIQKQMMGRLVIIPQIVILPNTSLERYIFPPSWCLAWLRGLPWPKEYDVTWHTAYSDRDFKRFALAPYLIPSTTRR